MIGAAACLANATGDATLLRTAQNVLGFVQRNETSAAGVLREMNPCKDGDLDCLVRESGFYYVCSTRCLLVCVVATDKVE